MSIPVKNAGHKMIIENDKLLESVTVFNVSDALEVRKNNPSFDFIICLNDKGKYAYCATEEEIYNFYKYNKKNNPNRLNRIFFSIFVNLKEWALIPVTALHVEKEINSVYSFSRCNVVFLCFNFQLVKRYKK